MPRFSVIVPAFNTAGYIGETIESVRRQAVPDWEMIVVDDGSADETAAVAAASGDPRIRVIRQENAGLPAARNRGAAEARGALFLFLDSDDRLRPGALERLSGALAAHPGAGVAYGEILTIDDAGRAFGTGKRPLFAPRPSGRVLPRLLERHFILPGTAMVRADCFRAAGGFNAAVRVGEDWEFFCRAAALAPFVYVGGDAVLEYRLRAGSMLRSMRDGEWLAGSLETVDRIFSDPRVTSGFSPRALGRSRRRREAATFSTAGTVVLARRDWDRAAGLFRECLRRHPARPRELILWLAARLRWLPPPLARRLK